MTFLSHCSLGKFCCNMLSADGCFLFVLQKRSTVDSKAISGRHFKPTSLFVPFFSQYFWAPTRPSCVHSQFGIAAGRRKELSCRNGTPPLCRLSDARCACVKEQFKPAALNFQNSLYSEKSQQISNITIHFFSFHLELVVPSCAWSFAVHSAVHWPFSDRRIEPHNSLSQITAASGIISPAEYIHRRDNYLLLNGHWMVSWYFFLFFLPTQANA